MSVGKACATRIADYRRKWPESFSATFFMSCFQRSRANVRTYVTRDFLPLSLNDVQWPWREDSTHARKFFPPKQEKVSSLLWAVKYETSNYFPEACSLSCVSMAFSREGGLYLFQPRFFFPFSRCSLTISWYTNAFEDEEIEENTYFVATEWIWGMTSFGYGHPDSSPPRRQSLLRALVISGA
jgi:hypothetical protein